MRHTRVLIATFIAAAIVLAAVAPTRAEPVKCQKIVAKALATYKKTYLKSQLKCLDLVNLGLFTAPCPGDVMTSKFAQRIEVARQKALYKINLYCEYPADLTTLEFHTADCMYGTPDSAAETTCNGKTVANASDFGDCLVCWKAAELAEYTSILFASQAVQNCGGALDSTSTVCSDIDCPGGTLPEQRNLGDTSENDCQRALAKGSIKYLVKRELLMDKCALKAFTRADCLTLFADKFTILTQKHQANVQKGCGVRDPAPIAPFCCKGGGNTCTIPSPDTRDQCLTDGGDPKEDQFCNAGNCDPVMGNKKLTWWGVCPEDDTLSCTTTLTQQDDMINCVQATANAIVDRLTCLEFPRNAGADYPCP